MRMSGLGKRHARKPLKIKVVSQLSVTKVDRIFIKGARKYFALKD